MSLGQQLATVARDLINEFGEWAQFSRVEGGTFNPVTGTKTGETSTTWDLKVTPMAYETQAFDGESIQTGDIKLMLAAVDYVPQTNDRVRFNNQDWFVISIPEFTRLQGRDVVYEVQVRK